MEERTVAEEIMSLVNTHEKLLDQFEKQQDVELPRLKQELERLKAAPSCSSVDLQIRQMERRINDMEKHEEEYTYLFEFGAWCFKNSLNSDCRKTTVDSPSASSSSSSSSKREEEEGNLRVRQEEEFITTFAQHHLHLNDSHLRGRSQFVGPGSVRHGELTCMIEIDWQSDAPKPEKEGVVENSAASPLPASSGSGAVVVPVSAWANRDQLCRTVLVKFTRQPAMGAYKSISINDQELEDGLVLCDLKKLKFGVVRESKPQKCKNKLKFALKDTLESWELAVFSDEKYQTTNDNNDETTQQLRRTRITLPDNAAALNLPNWATEHDISVWLDRPIREDAFFLQPANVRIQVDVGQAMETARARGLSVEMLVRTDRIISRRRLWSGVLTAAIRRHLRSCNTLDGFVVKKDGECKEEVFMHYIDMLDKLHLNAGAFAISKVNQVATKRKLSPIETAQRYDKVKRRRTNSKMGCEIQLRARQTVECKAQSQAIRVAAHEASPSGEMIANFEAESDRGGRGGGRGGEGDMCPKCGSFMTYLSREGASVCRGYEEEWEDCEGNIEIVMQPCGYTVADLDNSVNSNTFQGGPYVPATTSSPSSLSHTTYKRMYVSHLFFFLFSFSFFIILPCPASFRGPSTVLAMPPVARCPSRS